jgi:uncharacterized protein DUF6152
MKSKLVTAFVLVAGLFVVCRPVLAHHGTDYAYDVSKRVTLHGTVTKFVWSNPHAFILFDVTDDKGKVTHWGAEENPPQKLSVTGWTPDCMKPGDKITIIGAPSKTGAPRLMDQEVHLADGRVLKGLLPATVRKPRSQD